MYLGIGGISCCWVGNSVYLSDLGKWIGMWNCGWGCKVCGDCLGLNCVWGWFVVWWFVVRVRVGDWCWNFECFVECG